MALADRDTSAILALSAYDKSDLNRIRMVAVEVRSPVCLTGVGAVRARRDFVSLVDAAYDLSASETDWLRGLCEAANPVLGRGAGVFAFLYELGAGGATLQVSSPTFLGCPPETATALRQGTEQVTPQQLLRAYSGFPCQSLSQCHAHTPKGYQGFAPAAVVESLSGLKDFLIVRAADTTRAGCVIAAPAAQLMRFAPRTAGVMARIARHVATARRLRQCVVFPDGRPCLDVQAVLTDSGKLVHAEGRARDGHQRAALSRAVRSLVRGKARLRNTRPEDVVRLWTALVNGQWSILDSVDSDGRRYLLARRNTPDLPHPNTMLPIERHVASLVAMGNPVKLVAYELGLTVPAVSEILASALRRLRLRSRAELIQLFSA